MKSDGFIINSEIEYLTAVGVSLELTFEDICSTDEYDFTYWHNVVAGMDETKKQSAKNHFTKWHMLTTYLFKRNEHL